MKAGFKQLQIIISILIMIVLITNTSTAIQGAYEGIEVCIRTVIPALFPFFIVATHLNTSLLGYPIPLLHPIIKILNIPAGGDSLLLLGLIGGYPVGAQLVSQAYHSQQISKRTSRILLGYCSNAGPAFIFGIAGQLFTSVHIPIILWGAHIISALMTGILLPRPNNEYMHWDGTEESSMTSALKKSLHICAIVCGWIIIFKVILSYMEILLKNCPSSLVKILIAGFLELSNGCLLLAEIPSATLRFILCSAFLSFGGLCVIFQTLSAVDSIGLGLYIHGKIIQTAISIGTSTVMSFFLFPNDRITLSAAGCIILLCVIILLLGKEAAKRYGNSILNSV